MPCGDIRHVLLSRIRRLFEKTSSDVGLSDDAGQRANLELGMIRHRTRSLPNRDLDASDEYFAV
jgi:hypothetical protein